MIKNRYFLAITFFVVFLLLNVSFVSALEVQYPALKTASGQSISITANSTLQDYMFYLFNAGVGVGVLAVFISLVIAGAMYFLSPVSAEMRANAKDRVSGAISGLLILVLIYLIIATINPQLSVFKFSSLPSNSQSTTAPTQAPGVYFYKSSGCSQSDTSSADYTSSVADLGALKNQVNSVKIVQDTANQTYYISILYAKPNFWGKCQYINPNQSCQSVTPPFASSASIYKYDYSPDGDGVYFFRKSCFNDPVTCKTDPSACQNVNKIVAYCENNSGGYYKVPNSSINGIYIHDLNSLQFNIPNNENDEEDCIKYDENGECTSRSPQSLGGENISSMIINGNYLVLFVYQGPQGTASGPWTSCQEFPTPYDINQLGPRQIKWQNIRNNGDVVPNYVIIIPIQR